MKKMILFMVIAFFQNKCNAQNNVENFEILDTISFKGAVVVDNSRGVFFVEQEQIGKLDLFSIKYKKLKKLEQKEVFLAFLESIDFINLCNLSGIQLTNKSLSMPVEGENLLLLYRENEAHVAVGLVSLNLIKIRCNTEYLKKYVKYAFLDEIKSESVILYAYQKNY